MSYRGVAASAVFSFDEQGRVVTITSRRYLGNGTAAKLETWTVQMTRWQTRHGVVVPTSGAVAWAIWGPGRRIPLDALRNAEARLREHQRHLEETVRTRTAELRGAHTRDEVNVEFE